MAKTVLITGAYRGLGLEMARQLLTKDWDVILTTRKPTEGEKAVSKLGGSPKVRHVAMDVTSDASIEAAFKEVVRNPSRLEALINNAAVFPDPARAALDTSRDLVLEALNINTAGALRVAQVFAPLLAKAQTGLGRIVNVSSGLGALSDMQNQCTAYSISKTALNAVTRQLAGALADQKIVVNSVCPGWVRTEMGGPNAPRSVEEGASGIVWLVTDAPVDKTGLFWRDRQVIAW